MPKTNRTCHISNYFFCIIIVIALAGPAYSTDSASIVSDKNAIIQNIFFEGNKRTREKTILLFMAIDTGEVCDSTRIAIAENNLRKSGLFDYVKIFPILHKGKASLHVLVREKRYFSISDYSGTIYNMRYNEPTDRIWLQGYGTLTFDNFRGMAERIDVSASLIRIRYIGLSWYKPLITTPYYINIGTKIGSSPSVITPWHSKFFNSSFLSLGRNIGKSSNLSSSLIGAYRIYTWEGGKGRLYLNDMRKRELPKKQELLELGYTFNNSWVYKETTIVYADSIPKDTLYNTYEWKSWDSVYVNKHESRPYNELFLSLSWKTNKQNKYYNPNKGFYFYINALTNALYPYDDPYLDESKEKYLQLSSDIRIFHRGIWENNIVAYRVRPLARLFGAGNVYSGIYMGSEISLRGYGRGAFGGTQYNNRLLFSWEYRFPLVTLPEMKFPWLSWYDEELKSFHSRIDGALILDCGYIWKDLLGLRHPKKDHESAAGAGLGFRFMFPSLRRSVCAEIVFPFAFPEGYFEKYFPALYLYLDLPF